ncbi:CHAT domain-containing protein [Tolypothrix sp. VBCCA 56010]|uniref:CHAT domain-containing protein n=1 Tax=Tolypothrix sp. VBCCA 56010 TaxID=3137731 RepID=UPI003D7CD63A
MSKVIILAFAQIAVVSSTFALTADAASKSEMKIEISQQNQQSGNAKQLLQQGLKFYQTEQFSPAVEILQQAVQAFKSQGDVLNQALALNYLALAYQQQGDLPQASKAIAENLLLLSKNERNSQEYLSVRAQAFNTQGQIQLAQGQSNSALASWEQATALYSRNKDSAGKIGSQINQTQALQTLGLYRRALITLDQVNQQLQQQPDSLLKANGLLSLGNALRVVGALDISRETTSINSLGTGQAILQRLEENSKTMQFSRTGSLQALEQSLTVAQKLNSPELVAEIQLNLGNTAQALRNNTDNEEDTTQPLSSTAKNKEYYTTLALQYYQKAAATAVSPTTRLQAQLNQLRLSIQTNKPIPDQVSWRQIQSQLATLAPSRKIIYARINLTQSLACLKLKTVPRATATNLPCLSADIEENEAQISEKSKATPIIIAQASETPEWLEIAQIAKTAVDQAKNLQDKRAEAYALGTLGGIYEQTNQLAIAQTQTQQALTIAESISAPDIGYRWQWQLGRILSAKKDRDRIGAIAAYTKAVDNLKSIRRDLVAINPDVQFSFGQGVEPVFRQLVSLLLESKEPSQDNLKSARDVIESLRLAELDNYFRLACINAQPVQIDKVDQKAAVIYPVILRDRLEVIVSVPDFSNQTKQTFIHRTIALGKQEVDYTVDQLRQKLETRSTNEFKLLSQKVYNWIIAPIASELTNRKVENLVFVLDAPLGNIPMGALYDGKQYLIEKYNVALTPGLELLNPIPIARTNLRIIAGGLTEASQDFPALPNVQVELDAIKSKVANTRVLLNKQFNKDAIEDAVQSLSVPVIHLATHGQFSSKAEDTFILTYGNRVINVKDLNSLLQSRETNQRGAIELLVLSACSTAAGDKKAALGIAGVAVRSGARSTLASLWSVDDEGTSIVMREFYTQLKQPNITKAQAIRKAQVSLLTNPQYEHPYYWAPYVLVGNWL